MGGIFGQPQPALDAAGLGSGQVTGDPVDAGIVERLDHYLVVGAKQLEGGAHLADPVGARGLSEGRQQGQGEQQGIFHENLVSMGSEWGRPGGVTVIRS